MIASIASSAIYDLLKSGFHKFYHNIERALKGKIDNTDITLVHEAIKDLDKNSFSSQQELTEYLIEHLQKHQVQNQTFSVSKSPNAILIANSPNTSITLKKTQKNKPKVSFEGTIGAKHAERVYIKYLIDRYNKLKSAHEKDTMNYTRIYAAIKTKFKMRWDEVPIGRFDELADYLQNRIDNTIAGKKNILNGFVSYEDFCTFKAKHLGEEKLK